jgi:signal recognition particle receptor subunit beta
MAVINFARREIIIKIVYFGAPGAGTSSNVRALFQDTPGRPLGPLIPFGPKTESEQTLFYEMEPEATIPGFTLRVRLYAQPGALTDRTHRTEILRDLDGVVFVADARPGRTEANLDALLDLDGLVKELGLDLGRLPTVFQVNHVDHPEALQPEVVAYDLNPYHNPLFAAHAKEGVNVKECLGALLDQVLTRLRANLAGQQAALHVHAIHQRDPMTAEQVVESHERAIRLQRESLQQEAAREITPWSRSAFDILPAGPTVQVPYQPPELVGMRPVHALGVRIDRDTVTVDLVMNDGEGAHPTRLSVVLVPPTDATTPAQNGTVPAVPARDEVTANLPDRIEVVRSTEDPRSGLWYGIGGLAAGLITGILVGFLIWF